MTDTRSADEIVDELLPLYGPYDEDATRLAAQLVDATVRYLNYATRSRSALPYPSTIYSLAGALQGAVSKLQQTFDQAGSQLALFGADPNVVNRNMRFYDEPEKAHAVAETATIRAGAAFDQAGALAGQLAALLGEIQNTLSPIGMAVVPGDDER